MVADEGDGADVIEVEVSADAECPGAVAGLVAFKAQVSADVGDVQVLAAVYCAEVAVPVGGQFPGVRPVVPEITSPVTPAIFMPPPVLS